MTNNVFATRFDARSDIGPEVTPKVRLDSDWSRHSLGFEANADRIWYSEFPIADVKNYQMLMRGRLDVTSRTRLSGEIEKSQVQEGASSISITDIANAANSKLIEEHATAGIEHTFNRLTLKFTGIVADYDYTPIPPPQAWLALFRSPTSGTIAKWWAPCEAPMSSSRVGQGSSRLRSTTGTIGSRLTWPGLGAVPRASRRWPGSICASPARCSAKSPRVGGSSSRSIAVSARSQGRFSMAI